MLVPHLLRSILEVKRPSYGKGMWDLRDKIHNRLPSSYIDGYGNVILDLAKGEVSKTCFTAHLDTVHRSEGYNPLHYCANTKTLSSAEATQLGADDGTGVYILLSMIDANVGGLYIFTLDEEVGGLGSEWIAENTPELFESVDIAVGFDRKGRSDIIVEQAYGPCASEEFATSLSQALYSQNNELVYKSTAGVYTDTAEWAHLVSECTNLSVGYDREHTQFETQDIAHLDTLLHALIRVDWSSIVVTRTPADGEYYGDRYNEYQDDTQYTPTYPDEQEYTAIHNLVKNNPELLTDWIISLGYDIYELGNELFNLE